MVKWLGHWTCDSEAPSSSPTLTTSWICSLKSRVQILGHACKIANWFASYQQEKVSRRGYHFPCKLINILVEDFSLDQGNWELPHKNIKKSNRSCFGWTVLVTSVVSGKELFQDRGDLGSLVQYRVANLLELPLVQAKHSMVPAAHPHPKSAKVSCPLGLSLSNGTWSPMQSTSQLNH